MLLYQYEKENYPLTWYQRYKICGSLCKLVACTATCFFSSAAWPALPFFPLPMMTYIAIFSCTKTPSMPLNLTQQN